MYLGPAPGVGKTYAMLDEGWRRHERGTDVVIGIVETHGRAHTAEMMRDLEVIPRRTLTYRGAEFTEMDVDAVIARRPAVVLVDEYAHTNVPGTRNEKRWQDVEEILDAGIDVITTLNIQHLESVNDVIERITGVPQRETVPDDIVRRADQIELVDMSPEALRRRLAHGNVYAAEKVDAALANYFRPGNLGALREIALLWTADRVDEALERYRELHGIAQTWETRERIVVAMTGAAGGDALVRRAARTAMRTHGDLVGVHVRPQDGLAAPASGEIERHRALLEELGGVYREVAARRGRGPRRRGPRRERDAHRARREQPIAPPGARARIDHQPHPPPRRRRVRCGRHRPRGRPSRRSSAPMEPPDSPHPTAALARPRGGRDRPAAAHGPAHERPVRRSRSRAAC